MRQLHAKTRSNSAENEAEIACDNELVSYSGLGKYWNDVSLEGLQSFARTTERVEHNE